MAIQPVLAKNRFDLPEWAGAFGDLGTLIPFAVAYLSVLKMDANGLFVAFGLSLIAVGLIYRTPFPVQPMKAIGVAAVSQAALAAGMGATIVVGAALTTGILWIVLAATGLARRAGAWVPRPALLGVVMGLGFTFMLEGIRMMSSSPWVAGTLLALAFALLSRPRVPAMLVLLAIGVYGLPLLGLPALSLPGSAAAYLLLALSVALATCSLGLLLAALARSNEQALLLGGGINIILAALGGVMVPKSVMPAAMAQLAEISPMSWALDAFLTLLVGHGSLADIAPYCARLLLFAALFGIGGLLLFTRRVRHTQWTTHY